MRKLRLLAIVIVIILAFIVTTAGASNTAPASPVLVAEQEFRLVLSHIECAEDEKVEIQYILHGVPEGMTPGILTDNYGAIGPGAHTGSVWHYIRGGLANGFYNITGAAVIVGETVVGLQNPGEYGGDYICEIWTKPDPETRTTYSSDCEGVFAQTEQREWEGEEDGDWGDWYTVGPATLVHTWTDPDVVESWTLPNQQVIWEPENCAPPPPPEIRDPYISDCIGVYSQIEQRDWEGDDWGKWYPVGPPTLVYTWVDPEVVESWTSPEQQVIWEPENCSTITPTPTPPPPPDPTPTPVVPPPDPPDTGGTGNVDVSFWGLILAIGLILLVLIGIRRVSVE